MPRKVFDIAPFLNGYGVFIVDEAGQHALYFVADCEEDSLAESQAVVIALNDLYQRDE